MINDAILWVSNPVTLFQRVGGITVLERQLHAMRRAGLRRVWVSADQMPKAAAGLRLPVGLEVVWTNGSAPAPPQCQPPYLVVSGSHFIRVETLTHIVCHPGSARTTYLDDRQTSVVQVVPASVDDASPGRSQLLPEGASIPLQHPIPNAPTVEWLLTTGTKSQDGLMARHFDRHISLAISRCLLETRVSPNMMTVISSLVGLFGTSFFLIHAWGAHMTGATLIWLHSVLDGCDGELARIRFQESPMGADIDFWGDNLVHVSLFGCLSLGFTLADHSVMPLLAGLTATVGILGSAILVYRRRQTRRRLPAPSTPESSGSLLARVENVLEQRDFIYVLLILAYFNPDLGCTYAFMWAGAVGVILFFAMTLHIGRLNREQEFQPHRAS